MPSKRQPKVAVDLSLYDTDNQLASVKTILVTAIELEPSRRRSYVDSACEGNTELRSQVNKLLDLHERDETSVLDSDLNDILSAELQGTGENQNLETAWDDRQPKFEFGPQLGGGSFGNVFLAQQTSPIQREVAIKLLHEKFLSRNGLQRFKVEHQAQASMNHQNIARILDAGETEAGKPFLVMEYISGLPITRYCDEHDLSITDRVDVFLQVCSAIEHAHQKGVIHRDLKPSNILVATVDGKAVPKVIDFGVAKIIHESNVPEPITETGQLVGSLAYMSPEQANADRDIDTQSDIYSLGVLLYQLLTGGLPFGMGEDGLPVPPLELVRQICHDTPLPLWDAYQKHHLETSEPSALPRQTLNGDLGWVVMKCLEKERNFRYASVGHLIADVENHLNDRPVSVSPPSPSYRLRKFVRRNRRAVAVGSLVLFSVLLGLVGAGWGLVAAGRAEQRAIRQKLIAEKEKALVANTSAMAEEIKLFMGEIIYAMAVLNDDQLKNVLTAVLDSTGARLNCGHVTDPLIKAQLRRTIGLSYAAIGDEFGAEDALLASLEIKDVVGETDRTYLHMKFAQAQAFAAARNFERSSQIATEVLTVQQVNPNNHPEDLVETLMLVAEISAEQKQFDNALKYSQQALDISHSVQELSNHTKRLLLFQVGNAYLGLQKYQAARDTLLKISKLSVPGNVTFLKYQSIYGAALAKAYLALGDLENALKWANDSCQWSVGSDNLDLRCFEIKAIILTKLGQPKAAVAAIDSGLDIGSPVDDEMYVSALKTQQVCGLANTESEDFQRVFRHVIQASSEGRDKIELVRFPSKTIELDYLGK